MIRVSLIGVTGYTGQETLRLLIAHPQVELVHLVSTSQAGKPLGAVVPSLSHLQHKLVEYNAETLIADSDVVILAVPHGVSPQYAPDLVGKVKVLDLAGDFRLQSTTDFEQYYKHPHPCKALLPQFAYGLPEVNRAAILNADHVANTGCFASALQIAAYPFKEKIMHMRALGITGSSGSGKTAKAGTHHPVRNGNVSSYKIGVHQHIPELLQSCILTADQVHFVPTSGPFVRGIFMTVFLDLTTPLTTKEAHQHLMDVYEDSPAVRVMEKAQVAHVVGGPYVDISVTSVNDQLVVQVAIDNLMKGCASTAVQNLNLMCGLPEMTGLDTFLPLFP